MKRLSLLLVILAFIPASIFAQGGQIKGRITDDKNTPLQGVSVLVNGSKNGTQTDQNGNFIITLPGSERVMLVVSYTGFKEIRIAADGSRPLSIKMEPAASSLDDVVVIGYQTVKRKDLLASVSSVGARDLKDIPINSAAEALNGRLAGVTATTAEGSPDARVTIRIRGGMSITNDNSPLYIVDGVQVENALSVISPQEIQTIDVLKDAAATAIYGARGANGVIVITTRGGRQGRLTVSYNGFIGVRKIPKTLNVLSPYDYVIYQSERSRGSNTDSTTFLSNFGSTWDTLSNYKNSSPVNWQDEVFGRTGITQTHNVTASGGSKKITYNFGYTYNDEKAIVINSNYKRHLLNFKGDYKIINGLKAGITARYTHQDVLGAGVSSDQGSAYNRLRNAVKYRPFLSTGQTIDDADPIADPSVGNGLNLVNPLLLANSEYRKKTTDAYNFSAYVNYDITKNLSFRSTFGYNQTDFVDRQCSDSLTPYAIIQGGANPIAGLDTTHAKTFTNSNVLTYAVKGWKKKHDFAVLVGEETYDFRTESRSSLFGHYPTFTGYNTAFKETGIGTPFTGYPKLGKTRYTNLSFFGRVNYGFMDRYLFSFNIRADGASKFAPGKQWGYFPAGSFAWRASKEKFMEEVKFINDLKFRAGYGMLGNNRINDYLYLTSFASDGRYFYGLNNSAINAYYSPNLVNPDLQWEATVNRNLGLDVSFFNSRVNLSVDVYNNTSSKLLLNVPVASTYGYSTQLQNVGKTSNKGVEVQLNGVVMAKKNFTWNANFNISFNKNRVEALGLGQDYFYPGASWGVSGQPTDYIEKIGSPVGAMWGLVTDGFYKVSDFDYNPSNGVYTLKPGVVDNSAIIGTVQPGSIKFKDLNKDGVVDLDRDRTIIGNPTPKFTGGLNQQFVYRQWDASVFVNFSYGNDVYNANKIEFTNGYTPNSNLLAIMSNRWKVVTPTGATAQWTIANPTPGLPPLVVGIPPDQLAALNANATIWQPLRSAGAFYPSSWAIEDGSFLRINNITLGYSLPARSIAGLKMSKLRFYFTTNNVAIITHYSGYDPEVSVRNNPLTPGLDYSAYPKSRSFIFGVNATF
jgi:TonB-linked SusC/RagA family outer membrane protein